MKIFERGHGLASTPGHTIFFNDTHPEEDIEDGFGEQFVLQGKWYLYTAHQNCKVMHFVFANYMDHRHPVPMQ